jgi:hypothetical protein
MSMLSTLYRTPGGGGGNVGEMLASNLVTAKLTAGFAAVSLLGIRVFNLSLLVVLVGFVKIGGRQSVPRGPAGTRWLRPSAAVQRPRQTDDQNIRRHARSGLLECVCRIEYRRNRGWIRMRASGGCLLRPIIDGHSDKSGEHVAVHHRDGAVHLNRLFIRGGRCSLRALNPINQPADNATGSGTEKAGQRAAEHGAERADCETDNGVVAFAKRDTASWLMSQKCHQRVLLCRTKTPLPRTMFCQRHRQ